MLTLDLDTDDEGLVHVFLVDAVDEVQLGEGPTRIVALTQAQEALQARLAEVTRLMGEG